MAEPYIGQIVLWAVPWVPDGWHLCDGSLMQVSQYQALYSLIGNIYGGTSPTTFALPDLRNKFPIGTTAMSLAGQIGGSATGSVNAVGTGAATLSLNNLPPHNHAASFTPGGGSANVSIAIPAVSATNATTDIPGTAVSLSKTAGPAADIYSTATPDTTLAPFTVAVPAGGGSVTVGNTGSGTQVPLSVSVPVTVPTVPPFLALNYIIALEGIYPPRP